MELMDYRELEKSGLKFDRVVSVGMAEHVGRENYQMFIDCISSVLQPGGLLLLHFISELKEHPGDPWIKKYIFPGGVVPSLREMVSCLAEDGFLGWMWRICGITITAHFCAGRRILKNTQMK